MLRRLKNMQRISLLDIEHGSMGALATAKSKTKGDVYIGAGAPWHLKALERCIIRTYDSSGMRVFGGYQQRPLVALQSVKRYTNLTVISATFCCMVCDRTAGIILISSAVPTVTLDQCHLSCHQLCRN